MRRRSMLATAALLVPARLLGDVDQAFASVPDPTGSPVGFDARLSRARSMFDAGRYTALLQRLPGLLGDAHEGARSGARVAAARLSACYSLAAQLLIKIGGYERGRIAADRATVYADMSGSPLAMAAAAREMSIVLRHQGRGDIAERLMLRALAGVERTGLKTEAQSAAYAQLLCTTAYTAAGAGDRDQALSMMHAASAAARDLPDSAPAGRLFQVTPAAVDLYAVGVHRELGDAGSALTVGRRLHAEQFATAERRGRMHTDLARAWWQWGKPEQTAEALLAAGRVSPGEVRDRPSIRRIVTDLGERHAHVSGVRELAAVAAPSGAR